MFLNNPAATRSILTNNENVASFHRSKSIGGEHNNNVTKKTSFNENSIAATKTPGGKGLSKNNGQTTQRRRRALGDISNRKGTGAGGASGKGGLILKQQQTTTSKVNRTNQVKFSKTPSTNKSSTNTKSRLGGASINSNTLKSINSKPKQKQRASTEYDGVYGATTRWSTYDPSQDDDGRMPIPHEELNMIDNLRDEMQERAYKKELERDRLEDEKHEKQWNDAIKAVEESDARDIEELIAACDIADNAGDDQKERDGDEWDLLKEKMPWEEEDGAFDPTEERRLSGSDPYSLWGDINDF